MRCTVKKTLQVAVRSGNDVLVQVKGNQPKLLQMIMALAGQQPPSDIHHHDQLGQRNRIESRSTSVWPVAADCLGPEWSPVVRCLVRVRRHTEVFNTARAAWHPRSDGMVHLHP